MIKRDTRAVIRESKNARIRNSSRILEDADASKIDISRFPTKLSDAEKVPSMKDQVTKGTEDSAGAPDDIVKTSDASFTCSQLKPSQSSMNIDKAMGMAFGYIKAGKAGGKLGAFVSKDNYIMDGHHRWISTYMVDPSAEIEGYSVSLPGQQLVAALNALTAGKFGHKGKPATGGFEQFKDAAAMKAAIQKIMDEGIGGDFPQTPEEVQASVKKFGGDLDGCVEKFMKNLSSATMEVPSWAPTRPDMPVIEKENIEAAIQALNNGEIDLNPPYWSGGGEGTTEKKPENAGRVRTGHVVLERWQKLAGLIK